MYSIENEMKWRLKGIKRIEKCYDSLRQTQSHISYDEYQINHVSTLYFSSGQLLNLVIVSFFKLSSFTLCLFNERESEIWSLSAADLILERYSYA